jgi:hypothetical protein
MLTAVLLLAAAIAADEPTEFPLRRQLPEGTSITTPRDAVCLALADAQSLAPHEPPLVKYVWAPDWYEPGNAFAQVALVANSTFGSRSGNVIQPTSVAGGKLLRLDLAKFATSPEHLAEILQQYELLRGDDNFFNVEVALTPDRAIEVRSQANVRGQAPSPAPSPKTVFAAAAYLFPEGDELFRLTGSSVPIMRLDEWVAFSFSSIDGGKYYELAGVEKTLAATIEKFAGKEAANKVLKQSELMRRAAEEAKQRKEPIAQTLSRIDPELAKTKAYISHSGVTGRQRIVMFIYGTATSPAVGPQLVAVTFDIKQANLDPAADPLRGPTAFERYDGGEAILVLPNGHLLYLVFNAKDEIIPSVPDNVAVDKQALKVRGNVSTARVFSGVSCANCHEATPSNYGWQNVTNDLDDLLADDKSQADQLRALQIAAAQFPRSKTPVESRITFDGVLSSARHGYQFRAQLGTNQKTTRQTVAGIADSYWGYWYDVITPQVAARDLGQVLSPSAAQLFLLRAIDPAPDGSEDGPLARLKLGRSIDPVQWRTGYQSFAERTHFKPLEVPLEKLAQ